MSKTSDALEKLGKEWKETSHLEAFYILLIIGSIIAIPIIMFANRVEPSTTTTPSSDTTPPTSKVLTPELANTYVGRTLKEFCAKFGDYVNVHTYAFSMEHGGGGTPCSEVGKGYYFDKYIISQAYYDDEDTRTPKVVYVDSMPENEAIEAGITIKKGN